MMYGNKYDDDDYDNDNLDCIADYDILILSCICYAMLFLSILFYCSAILATTSINACLLAYVDIGRGVDGTGHQLFRLCVFYRDDSSG